MKIPYITLWCVNYNKCDDFYVDKLGLPLESADESFAQLAAEPVKLYLHRIKGTTEILRNHSVELHFEVDDVDERFNLLQRNGVYFESPPENMPWGVRMAGCRDPEGYSIEIVGPVKK